MIRYTRSYRSVIAVPVFVLAIQPAIFRSWRFLCCLVAINDLTNAAASSRRTARFDPKPSSGDVLSPIIELGLKPRAVGLVRDIEQRNKVPPMAAAD